MQTQCNFDFLLDHPFSLTPDVIQIIQDKYVKETQDNESNELNYELLSEIMVHLIHIPKMNESAGKLLVFKIMLKKTLQSFEQSDRYNEPYNQKLVKYHDLIIELDKKYQDFNYKYDYFSIKTLINSYLQPNETPVQMLIRVALQMSLDEENITTNVDLLCRKRFIHASPTLFNSGLKYPQLSSCFLMSMESDSIEGIYETLKQSAMISKHGGGIAISVSNIRAKGSLIRSTQGQSQGLCMLLKVINESSRYVNQSSKRKGSIAIYLEPWHADIQDFLNLRRNQGLEQDKCRDLFLSLYVPDLFMSRVKNDQYWSLFCPDMCPDLVETHSQKFEQLYIKYEEEKKYIKQIKARDLFNQICETQIETGMPYITFKDQCNRASNQNNLGQIKSSNLCVSGDTMIMILRDDEHQIFDIKSLVGQKVRLWNGFEFSESSVFKTGENVDMMKICFENRHENDEISLKCTPYHKFYIEQAQSEEFSHTYIDDFGEERSKPYSARIQIIQAQDLKVGMKIMIYYGIMKDKTTTVLRDVYVKNIQNIQQFNTKEDSYCVNEPLRNQVVFNGVLTGNCNEIVEYSSDEETAVCNLAAINLPKYVTSKNQTFDFKSLEISVKQLVVNLNNIIDINYYPDLKCMYSNMKNRPIGIGIMGLHQMFMKLKMPFDSPEARVLSRQISEHIYYYALQKSIELAKEKGQYNSFPNSQFSKGILQFDNYDKVEELCIPKYEWDILRDDLIKYGSYNSLLTCCQPTASVSQIIGCISESFEPITSNLYTRRTLSGDFIVINKYLFKYLNISKNDIEQIIQDNGSIKNLSVELMGMKDVFKTVFEIKMKDQINLCSDRQRFIDQSQSMNVYFSNPTIQQLSSSHFYSWENQLKCGMYYLRQRNIDSIVKFTIQKEKKEKVTKNGKKYICSQDICTACQ